MQCTNCHADVGAWLRKYQGLKKVRLDEMYFRDEKLVPKYDESGVYIDGQKFYDHEMKRSLERCPKCGSKNSVTKDEEFEIWAPI